MKTFIKRWLVPPFLKRWDTYLLTHYPVLWHSRAIWIVFYGLTSAVILFAAGFFYPLDAQHLTVDPIRTIEIERDAYYWYTVLFLSLGLLYWAFHQYPLGFPFSQAKEVLLTVSLYALCFWVLLGITAPAFRMGTIYKTAYHWMSDEDLKSLEESGIYPYGFVLLESDTAFTTPPADTFFQRREEILKAIVRVEDTLLQNSYSYQIALRFLWDRWDRMDLVHPSYRSYLSYRMDLVYPSYILYRLYLPDMLDYLPDVPDVPDVLDWTTVYKQYKKTPPLPQNLGDYKFANTIDSIRILSAKEDTLWLERPALPYSVEDAVRSVKHARLYWEEGIYFRHLFHILHYVLLAALVLLGLPLLRLKNMVIVVVVVAVTLISMEAAGFYDSEENYTTYWGTIQYLILPALALGGLGISVVKKKYYPTTLFFFTLAIINILIPLTVIGYGLYSDKISYPIYPSNLAFYGLQALALVAALLMPYVRALPKVD